MADFSIHPFQKKVEKPWGYEIIYTRQGLPYTGKIIFLKAGHRFSLQQHDSKRETLCLYSGQAAVWLENSQGQIEKISMVLQQGYSVALMQKHRVEAITDSFIIESSQPEQGATIRVQDDFKRSDETEQLRQQPNRGWQD